MLRRLAAFCYSHRWRVLIAWIVLLVGVNVLAQTVGGDLLKTFNLPGTESQRAYDTLAKFDPKTAKFTYYPYPNLTGFVPKVETDAQGTIWFAIGTTVELDSMTLMSGLFGMLVVPLGLGQLLRVSATLARFAETYRTPLGVASRLLIFTIMLRAALDTLERLGGDQS